MSFRNGDKSREHRLRKARQKMRRKVRGLQSKRSQSRQPAAASEKVNRIRCLRAACRPPPSPVCAGFLPCKSATIAW